MGIRPILGAHLVLEEECVALAMDEQGWGAICRAITEILWREQTDRRTDGQADRTNANHRPSVRPSVRPSPRPPAPPPQRPSPNRTAGPRSRWRIGCAASPRRWFARSRRSTISISRRSPVPVSRDG
jgi:hypothetical protein